MGSPTWLTDSKPPVVADTSTVINLNATGCVEAILTAIPNRILVVDAVREELEEGRRRGRPDAELLDALVAAGHVEIVTLGETALVHFEALVIGPATTTLDDGEAATIAFAVAHGSIALVDERKATRLCTERFSEVSLGCTGDALNHPEVLRHLGREALAVAVFNAIYHGRMRVFPRHIDWVLQLIGPERAAVCTSLRGSARRALGTASGARKPSRK